MMTENEEQQKFTGSPNCIAVVGLSGAGRSTTLNVLEDCGYHPIDNLPPELLERLFAEPINDRKLALGFGAMSKSDHEKLNTALKGLVDKYGLEILFIEASDDVILKRYGETRRRHFHTEGNRVLDGVQIERELLADTRQIASARIDTSTLSPHDLRREIKKLFHLDREVVPQIHIKSFAYKNGIPRDADMVFDCRFLKNPHWDEALRPLDGRDHRVAQYVQSDPAYGPYTLGIQAMIAHMLPAIKEEGRSYFTVCFGCTGGKHRSVAIAEMMHSALIITGWRMALDHRELPKREEKVA